MPKAKAQEETVWVHFQWTTVAPDPTQFKPYNPTFAPLELVVAVEVPSKYVLSQSKGATVLTPDGMAYATKELAKSISRAHGDMLR